MATLQAGDAALNRGDLSQVMALIYEDITFDAVPMSPIAANDDGRRWVRTNGLSRVKGDEERADPA